MGNHTKRKTPIPEEPDPKNVEIKNTGNWGFSIKHFLIPWVKSFGIYGGIPGSAIEEFGTQKSSQPKATSGQMFFMELRLIRKKIGWTWGLTRLKMSLFLRFLYYLTENVKLLSNTIFWIWENCGGEFEGNFGRPPNRVTSKIENSPGQLALVSIIRRIETDNFKNDKISIMETKRQKKKLPR